MSVFDHCLRPGQRLVGAHASLHAVEFEVQLAVNGCGADDAFAISVSGCRLLLSRGALSWLLPVSLS